MSIVDVINVKLSASWPRGGDITIQYPSGRGPADYGGSDLHYALSNSVGKLSAESGDISFFFGPTDITVTNNVTRSITSGVVFDFHMRRPGVAGSLDPSQSPRLTNLRPVFVTFGVPLAAGPAVLATSQDLNTVTGLTLGLNGAMAQSGVGTFDMPRNIVASWTGSAAVTFYGTDEFGAFMAETSEVGTSHVGKKAFKTVSSVNSDSNISGVQIGMGDVLGLPAFLRAVSDVISEGRDGVQSDPTGTFVVGDTAVATGTTGDVRGTYEPVTPPDGVATLDVTLFVKSASYTGTAQFTG